MKAYWWRAINFGDLLTPIILEHFLGEPVEFCAKAEPGRIVGVGSIVHHAKPGDVVFGSGCNRPKKVIDGTGIRFLAVRGPLTRKQIINAEVPEIYGDPAILLPEIYFPEKAKIYKRGILPHYVDKPKAPEPGPGEILIDIQAPWKEVIDRVLECEEIISSSLHGIIVAEAYGIPATWAEWGDKIIGGRYKFQDYFLGSGRPEQRPGRKIPPISDLAGKQKALIDALKNL